MDRQLSRLALLIGGAVAAILGTAACGATAPAAETSRETSPSVEARDREALLDLVETTFRERYAPLDYKRARGWSLEDELAGLRAVLLANPAPTAHDVRRSLYRFVRSPGDIHTGVAFAEVETRWLGLHLRKTEGTYVVAWIEREVRPRLDLRIGDEVLTWNGTPIDDEIDRVQHETGYRSTPGFTQRFAEWFLSVRSSAEWSDLPVVGSTVELGVVRAGTPLRVSLSWLDMDARPPSPRPTFWGRTTESYVPELGDTLWTNEPSETTRAAIFQARGKQVGYLRIHSYQRSGEDAVAAIDELDRALDEMIEESVAAIVLDQTGNDGGSFPFALTMLSRLSPTSLRAPDQRYLRAPDGRMVGFPRSPVLRETTAALTRAILGNETITEAFRTDPILRSLRFLPHSEQSAAELRMFLERVLSNGDGPGLTEPHFQIVERYVSDPARGRVYEGPLVMVIDALNISAAEYTAAAFSDSGRAVLFGATTAGAGGDQRTFTADHVCGASGSPDPLSPCLPPEAARAFERFGIASLSFTVTLGERTGRRRGVAIENRGVEPTVAYTLTRRDVMSGYQPLREALLDHALAP